MVVTFLGKSMNTRPNIVSYNVVPLTTLTERQRQVATLACEGLRNREIAETLGVAEGTVKIHLNMIYEKLNVRSRTDLIIRFGASQRVA
jgi:DNA-binding NarL/FixJ family response regulator